MDSIIPNAKVILRTEKFFFLYFEKSPLKVEIVKEVKCRKCRGNKLYLYLCSNYLLFCISQYPTHFIQLFIQSFYFLY